MNSFVFRASSTTIAEYLRLLNCLRVIQQYSGVFLALLNALPILSPSRSVHIFFPTCFYSTKPLSLALWFIPSCRPRHSRSLLRFFSQFLSDRVLVDSESSLTLALLLILSDRRLSPLKVRVRERRTRAVSDAPSFSMTIKLYNHHANHSTSSCNITTH